MLRCAHGCAARWRQVAIAVVTAVAGLPVPGLAQRVPPAQGVTLARFSEVRRLVDGGACEPAPRVGEPSSLSRVRGGRPEAAWPLDPVLSSDSILVQLRTDVRIRADARFGRGTIYLAPELGRCRNAASALQRPGVPVPPGGTGVYSFDIDSVRTSEVPRERIVLTVHNGGVVVEWDSGGLSVFALGREVRPIGSTFAVLVNAATQQAMVYVLEGVVQVGTPRAGPGQAISFGRTGAPALIANMGQAFVTDVQYHSGVVWTRSLRPFPWKWVGIGAAAAAGIVTYRVCCEGGNGGTSRPFQGTIVIRIPL